MKAFLIRLLLLNLGFFSGCIYVRCGGPLGVARLLWAILGAILDIACQLAIDIAAAAGWIWRSIVKGTQRIFHRLV